MKVLVVDIGGSHVKVAVAGRRQKIKFSSGPNMTPATMVRRILKLTADWNYEAVSIGFPGPVMHGKVVADPPNLSPGWIDFPFEKQFGKPVKVMNDAAMQALGSYRGGRMLFLGLGTGLGSALILDDVIVPLELGELRYSRKKTLAQVLSKAALKKQSRREWERAVHDEVQQLAAAFRTDSIVIGGGLAKHLTRLPRGARRGSNDLAFVGGARLWRGGSIQARPRKHTWVIV